MGTNSQRADDPLSELVPTNWLDSLLTGPDAVLPKDLKAPLTHEHVAELLRRVKKRIQNEEARRSEREQNNGEDRKSDQRGSSAAQATGTAAPSPPSSAVCVSVPIETLEEINRDAWSDEKPRMRLIARTTDKLLAAAPVATDAKRNDLLHAELVRLKQWFDDRLERPGCTAQSIIVGMVLSQFER